MADSEVDPLRNQVVGELSASRPPLPFEQGKELGLVGAPIPPEVVTLFREFHRTPSGTLDSELSGVFSRPPQEEQVVQEMPETDAQRMAAAFGLVQGYASGLSFYLSSRAADGRTRLGIEAMATLHPNLCTVPDGLEAYVVGHSLQRPAHLEDGQVYKGNISVADAHALGFLVRAATLGIRIDREELPLNERDWDSFIAGMTEESKAFARIADQPMDPATFDRAMDMTILGAKMQLAIKRASTKANAS